MGDKALQTTIRRAAGEDYVALCSLFGIVDALHRARLPHMFQAPAGPARPREYMEALLADAQTAVFLAEAGGRAVGCLVAMLRPRPPLPIFVPGQTAIIDTLVVDPTCRRQGIGRALMAAAEAWAEEQGAASLELNVYEFNEDAIAFYRALGYETLMRRMVRGTGGEGRGT